MRTTKRETFGGQLGMAEMDMLYGRARKLRPEPEPFADKARRLHRQGLKPHNIAFMTNTDLAEVLEALRQDVPA
jgi:hypothetical protein